MGCLLMDSKLLVSSSMCTHMCHHNHKLFKGSLIKVGSLECVVPENIHAHPMDGHWKFQGGGGEGGGSQKFQFLKKSLKLN